MISIDVKNVTKTFKMSKPSGAVNTIKKIFLKSPQNEFTALNNISFTVSKGEMIGIIGLNGSGKTTLLRTISGVYKPDTGKIRIFGRVAPLLQIGTGFHDELNARDNIVMYGMLLGFSKCKIKEKISSIIEFAELKDFEYMILKHYSTGMRARLAFSTALQIDPEILLVDEILAVGDLAFRKKSFDAFLSFKKENKTILYTSHNISNMPQLCDRVILLHQANVVMVGKPTEVIAKYKEIIANK